MSLSLTLSEMLEKIHEQSSWIRNASLIQEDYHLEQLRKIRYVWHHEEFLNRLHTAPHDKSIMTFLKDHTAVDMEKEILRVANSVKKKVMKEIEAART